MISDSKQQVFKSYYGFLCVRHLLHIVCMTILLETATLGTFVESLAQDISWNEFARATSNEALQRGFQSMPHQLAHDYFETIFKRPTFDFGTSSTETNIVFLVRVLWEDRGSFFTLCSRGLLPGCTMLLLTAWKLMCNDPDGW
jgi:hypothetical protein